MAKKKAKQYNASIMLREHHLLWYFTTWRANPSPPIPIPLHSDTSHFPTPFLSYSPPLLSVSLSLTPPFCFCFYSAKEWLVLTVSARHSYSHLKPERPPPSGLREEAWDWTLECMQGDLHHLWKYFLFFFTLKNHNLANVFQAQSLDVG